MSYNNAFVRFGYLQILRRFLGFNNIIVQESSIVQYIDKSDMYYDILPSLRIRILNIGWAPGLSILDMMQRHISLTVYPIMRIIDKRYKDFLYFMEAR